MEGLGILGKQKQRILGSIPTKAFPPFPNSLPADQEFPVLLSALSSSSRFQLLIPIPLSVSSQALSVTCVHHEALGVAASAT